MLRGMLDYMIQNGDGDISDIVKAIEDGTVIDVYYGEITQLYKGYSRPIVMLEECPICMLQTIPDNILLQFIERKYGIKKEAYIKEIQNNFEDFEALISSLKKG